MWAFAHTLGHSRASLLEGLSGATVDDNCGDARSLADGRTRSCEAHSWGAWRIAAPVSGHAQGGFCNQRLSLLIKLQCPVRRILQRSTPNGILGRTHVSNLSVAAVIRQVLQRKER